MLPKVRLVFDRKKVCKNNSEGDVEVYVYHLGKKRYLATGVRCRKREYKEGTISVRADAVELNKRLQWCLRTIQEQVNAMVEQDCVSLPELSLSFTDKSGDFLEWMEDQIESKDARESTKKQLLSLVNVLRREDIFKSFADLTLLNIEKFNKAIKNLNPSTKRSYHINLKAFINKAIKLGILNVNPYDKFSLPKDERLSAIKYLTQEELAQIEAVKVGKNLAFTKDMFLLGCYTGLRWSDICEISPQKKISKGGVNWLSGIQKKTGNKFEVMLFPESEAILDKYNWDMSRISLCATNINLKRLALLAGLNKLLTMHMSRHTFATMALSKGVRMEVVSKMLGHTDIKMTQIYAKVLQQDVEKGFEMLMQR